MRPLARLKTSSRFGPATFSLGAKPGRSPFVESPQSSSSPSRPSSARRETSAGLAVDRRLVELVVAGDEDRAELGLQRDRARIRDRVRHVDQLDVERAGLDDLAVLDVLDVDVARELVLVELGARHRHRQRAAVDRRRVVDAELAQQERQAAEMVLVAVRDDDRLDVRDAAAQVREVGQDEVDAHHLGRGEAQADVHEDDAVLVLDDRHVLADLAQAAKREDAQLAAQTIAPMMREDGGCRVKLWLRRAARDPATSHGSWRFRARLPRRTGSRGAPTQWPSRFSAALFETAAGATPIAAKTGTEAFVDRGALAGLVDHAAHLGTDDVARREDPAGLAHVEDAGEDLVVAGVDVEPVDRLRGCRCWPA